MSFASLGLSEALVRAVNEHGYTQPTPIQLQAIPAVLAGGDLMAGAQTGTGKTAGFVLPMLQRMMVAAQSRAAQAQGGRPAKPVIRALILTPTRELAAQVEESVRTYGKYTGLKSMVMFGGVGINPQISALRSGVDIVVATPGRLLDHAGQNTIDLKHVEFLVLDEADRMLDMGFIHDIKRVLKLLPTNRQNLLFSATFSDDIKALADNLLKSPALIEVARRNATADTIAQKVHPVDRDRKRELLSHLIKRHNWFQVLVFTRTKHGANRLAEQLEKDGISALAIHGNKSQGARTRALSEFKAGDLQVLVATDIAARGIDIDQLPHVVNYELPNVPEDYVHRIGRTGRAGAEGEAISLVCIDEAAYLRDIERLIKREIPSEVIAGFEPNPNDKAQPIQLRTPGHRPGRQQQGRGQQGQGKKPATPRQGQGQGAGQGRGAAQGKGGQGQQRTAAQPPKPQGGKPPNARGKQGTPRQPANAGGGKGGNAGGGGSGKPAQVRSFGSVRSGQKSPALSRGGNKGN
jgi:ATP-dependent RNA helicase RhlE